ncbi:MAG TPA: flavodoxin [Firmicutes bacterium]|jgi:hypothetical protein|nr:flavodoxin [Bacillota bacterium]
MKNVVLINASPKISGPSLSNYLVTLLANQFDLASICLSVINIRQSITKRLTLDDFTKLKEADAVVIVFPLYFYCTPGILMRFLEDYQRFIMEQGSLSNQTKVYTIINCGFPEPERNREAVRVIASFCKHVKAHFRFGVLIGGGGMLLETKNAGFMKKTIQALHNSFLTIANDIQNNEFETIENIDISVKFPKILFRFIGGLNWISLARKNGLKKKDLYRQPYR